jgi:hypothetical protein
MDRGLPHRRGSASCRIFKAGLPGPLTLAQAEMYLALITGTLERTLNRIEKIEQQLAAVEQKHQQFAETVADEVLRYQGIWRQDKTFPKGSCVTHHGGLWFAVEATDTRPGTDGFWKLTVKSGHAP